MFADIFMSHAKNIIGRLWSGGEAGYDNDFDINEGKIGFKKNIGAI